MSDDLTPLSDVLRNEAANAEGDLSKRLRRLSDRAEALEDWAGALEDSYYAVLVERPARRKAAR